MFVTYNSPHSSDHGCTLSILAIDDNDPELILVGAYNFYGEWNEWWVASNELDGFEGI